jgi:hypothetical protein
MENQTPETQQPNQPLMITLADLDMLKQIIELATKRGAFQAPELADVGIVYNKLAAFLNMALEQAKTEQEVANPPTPDNSESVIGAQSQGE